MANDKPKKSPPLVADADKFDALLKRMIDHAPAPKKTVSASRKKKLTKVIGPS
jgi:hypothetical protein